MATCTLNGRRTRFKPLHDGKFLVGIGGPQPIQGFACFPIPSFWVDLFDMLAPRRALGGSVATYSRSAKTICPCYGPSAVSGDPLLWTEIPIDEVPFYGARRVSAGVWSRSYADGTPISGMVGLALDVNKTQLLNSSRVRNLTDAAYWVPSNMTTAYNATGADGVANKATTLTATAPNATLLATITAAASNRRFFCLVRRKTGTGTILLKQTGTTSDITSLINSTTYTMVGLNASILNVQVGFQINTSGDEIEVDYCNFVSMGANDTWGFPIPEGVGASVGSRLTYNATARTASMAAGTFFAESMKLWSNHAGSTLVSLCDSTANRLIRLANGNGGLNGTFGQVADNGPPTSFSAGSGMTLGVVYKHAIVYDNTTKTLYHNGVAGTPTPTPNPAVFDTLGIGNTVFPGVTVSNGASVMRRAKVWARKLTAAQIAQL